MPKALHEKRNTLITELEGLVEKAKSEVRALQTEELDRVEAIKTEIRAIDATIDADNETRKLERVREQEQAAGADPNETEIRKLEQAEDVAIRSILKGETRDLTSGGQGVIIPKTISSKIIDKVVQLSPILSRATVYNLAGDLVLPTYDYTAHIPAGYYTEMATITGQNANFGSVTLTNNIVVSLALISKSLVNRTDVNVVPFVVNAIAQAMAHFLEKELVAGAGGAGKMDGLAQISAGQTTTGATTLVIDPAELVILQAKVPDVFQGNAAWLMHTDTFAYLSTLKATDGKFLLGNTLAENGGRMILGKPVMLSDNMPKIGVNALEIFYGDFSGLSVKITDNVQVQVLMERYADQYAIGVLGSVEIDSIITEPQKLVAYKGK